MATVVSNHLTAGIMKYFGDSGRFQQAANLFEKLAVREPEVNSLLAKSYIGMSASISSSGKRSIQLLFSTQMRRSRLYKLWRLLCTKRPSRTLCYILSAIF